MNIENSEEINEITVNTKEGDEDTTCEQMQKMMSEGKKQRKRNIASGKIDKENNTE